VRQNFSTTYDDFIGSIFQPCEMRAVGEQNAITFFACLTEKVYWANSPYALNELNSNMSNTVLANMKKIKILSFYPR
jgi:hypothetical protein